MKGSDMFKTLSTLIAGVNARSEDRVRDAFAIELIDQKIREAEQSLKAAKATLASLIQRQRSEERQRDTLKKPYQRHDGAGTRRHGQGS
jgi:phage shock protein A